VPDLAKRKYPQAKIASKKAWYAHRPTPAQLDPLDPLFPVFATTFYETQRELFGAYGFYATDPFHEGNPPVDGDTYLSQVGAEIVRAIDAADPKGVACMQAWSLRMPIVRGFPKDRLLILDIGGSRAEMHQGFGGVPFVSGLIWNFGGRTHSGGALSELAKNPFAAAKAAWPNCVGSGLFPEGIHTAPLYFAMALDMQWSGEPVDSRQWLGEYLRTRYAVGPVEADRFADLLLTSLYSGCPSGGGSILVARPQLGITKADPNRPLEPPQDEQALLNTWKALTELVAEKGEKAPAGLRYDLADVARAACAGIAFELHRQVTNALAQGNATAFRQHADRFLDLMADLDAMLAKEPLLDFAYDLKAAEACGTTPAERALYSQNETLLLTQWGPFKEPSFYDYAWREWSGLLRGYYAPRWKMFFEAAEKSLTDSALRAQLRPTQDKWKRPANRANAFYSRMADFEEGWIADPNRLERTPVRPLSGTLAEVSMALLKKWTPFAGRGHRTGQSGTTSSEAGGRLDDGYVLPEAGADGKGVMHAAGSASTNRLAWLDSRAGEGTLPTNPFTPVVVDESTRKVSILGRTLTLGENGLPTAYVSFFNGSNTRVTDRSVSFFAAPVRFSSMSANGKSAFRFVEKSATRAVWRSTTIADGWMVTVDGSLGFDGYATFEIRPEATRTIEGFTSELVFEMPRDRTQYAMGLGLEGGDFPESLDWTWDVARQQDALWFGSVNVGAMVRLKGDNWRRPHVNVYYKWRPLAVPETWGTGGVRVRTDGDRARVIAFGGVRTLRPGEKPLYAFDLYLTPFKPVDLKTQFATRHLHLMQHSDAFDVEGTKREGATVVTLHHNTVWNPYINYPLNEDGGPLLKQKIEEAHKAGLRVRCYYTTREISQNIPEFSALAALGDEIFARKPKDDPTWPITNPKGPHPWLMENVGNDILPAWRETIAFDAYPHKLDLAVITQPDSRWNNFYLEGLKHLVEDYGLDGVYIDDSALNREALMRARRILDSDGRTNRLIDIHSWNHHSKHAGVGNSAVIYMELLPFVNQLWIGEGFKIERPDAYWLVERSGIPFGVTGEVLPQGKIYSPFIPFLYGMTDRWGHYGHPQHFWKLMDRYALGEAEFFGYWDEDNPVRVKGAVSVKASVFKSKRATVVVVADMDFAYSKKTCSLVVDWQRLGLSPDRAVWKKPVIGDDQMAGAVDPTRDFTLDPDRIPWNRQPDGAVFVVEGR